MDERVRVAAGTSLEGWRHALTQAVERGWEVQIGGQALADLQRHLDGLARLTALHARETLIGLVVGDCAMEECDHEGECPRTGSLDVCAGCLRLAEEAVSHYGEDGYGDEVVWPCATIRAINGEGSTSG